MSDSQIRKPYHVMVTLALVLMNLAAIGYALFDSEPGFRDYHFVEDVTLLHWLGAAQMLGAALLYIACYFADGLIPQPADQVRGNPFGWLVFAVGFFILSLDQQFNLREQLTALIDGSPFDAMHPSTTHTVIKIISALAAFGIVVFFRTTVLANFRMVLYMVAGFWFLLMMFFFDMLFQSLGVSAATSHIMQVSSKLLAMAMFLSASYAALLDRMGEARVMAIRLGILEDGQRRLQHHEGGDEERAPLELGKASTAESSSACAPEEPSSPGGAPVEQPPKP
jgi:hypothetical protein